jgi:hypothetical protein
MSSNPVNRFALVAEIVSPVRSSLRVCEPVAAPAARVTPATSVASTLVSSAVAPKKLTVPRTKLAPVVSASNV